MMDELIEAAKAVLEANWTGEYTRPSSLLYPHQWNWDSGFIAIGYSNFDQKRAQTELISLFDAQWKNGMVPHVVFWDAGDYFPGPDFWDAGRSGNAPADKSTSGITQPPIHATAARLIFERAGEKPAAKDFLKKIYPKLVASHSFFYRERDPAQEGLVYIRHPWESGIDNSPIWDAPLNRIKVKALPDYIRQDLKKGVPEVERPSDEDYDKYVYLVELFKKHNYDEKNIYQDCSFIVQDTLFNSILARSNTDLVEIGRVIGADTSQVEAWEKKTAAAIRSKLWNKDHRFFDDYDFNADKMIDVDTASGFLPLYARVPTKAQVEHLYKYLDSKSFCDMHQGKCFSVPNFDMQSQYFDATNYWRGPIWINMNWMLWRGLLNYGLEEKAASVREDIIELIRRYGFFEYFDPIQGRGLGSKDFSWTAALFLDAAIDSY